MTAEDLASVLRQVKRATQQNHIYHLQNNLQPLVLHRCSSHYVAFVGELQLKLHLIQTIPSVVWVSWSNFTLEKA